MISSTTLAEVRRRPRLQEIATFLILAVVTISWASTTSDSISVFGVTRSILICVLVPALIFRISESPQALPNIVTLFIAVSIFGGYSLMSFWTFAEGGMPTVPEHVIWVLLTVAVGAVFLLSPPHEPLVSHNVARAYVYLALAALVITIILGGLRFEGVPRFVYDFETSGGTTIGYSQGTSKFYGLAAVFSAIQLDRKSSTAFGTLRDSALCVLLLFLSFIGGGRGEFVITAFLCGLIVMSLPLAALAGTGLLWIFSREDSGSGILTGYGTIVERYATLPVSLGSRDSLLSDGVNLLSGEPKCGIIGCGIGFFQHYFGYAPGLYPHNIPLEFLIFFGLWLAVPVVVLTFLGIGQVRRMPGDSTIFWFTLCFFFAVSLKSGSLLTSYLLAGGVAFLAVLGLNRLSMRSSPVEKGS